MNITIHNNSTSFLFNATSLCNATIYAPTPAELLRLPLFWGIFIALFLSFLAVIALVFALLCYPGPFATRPECPQCNRRLRMAMNNSTCSSNMEMQPPKRRGDCRNTDSIQSTTKNEVPDEETVYHLDNNNKKSKKKNKNPPPRQVHTVHEVEDDDDDDDEVVELDDRIAMDNMLRTPPSESNGDK
jgi:hypothetical protein